MTRHSVLSALGALAITSVAGCFDLTPETYTGLCSTNRACKDGTMCIDGVCRDVCGTDNDCASDMLCLDSACLPLVDHPCDTAAAAVALSAVVSTDAIDLTWQSAADNTYEMAVQRDVGGAGFVEVARVAGTAREYTDATPACRDANAWCKYRIQAQRRRDGCLTPASGVVRTAAMPQPALDASATTLASGMAIVVSWTDPNMYEDGYRVERAEAGTEDFDYIGTVTSEPDAAGATMSITDEGLSLDQAFVYRITAFSEAVGYEGETEARVSAWTSPIRPESLTAQSLSGTSIGLAWEAHATETGYVIERTSAGGTFEPVATIERVSSYTDTSAAPDTYYTYRVSAVNQGIVAVAEAQRSAAAEAGAWTRPRAVQALGAEEIAGVGVRLLWDEVNSNETGIRVERRLVGRPSFTQVAVLSPDTTSYLDDQTGSADYRITVINAGGESEAVAIGATMPPGMPRDLVVETTSPYTLRLHWSDTNVWETGYRVERQRVDSTYEVLATVGPNVTSFDDSGLSEDTIYQYRVTTLSQNGESNPTLAVGSTSRTPQLSWTGQVSISPACVLTSPGAVSLDDAHGASFVGAYATSTGIAPDDPSATAHGISMSLLTEGTYPSTGEISWSVADSLGGVGTLTRGLQFSLLTPTLLTDARLPSPTIGGDAMVGRQALFPVALPQVQGCPMCSGRRGSLAAGSGFTIALTPQGRVLSWGYNSVGQLGDGTTSARTAPAFVCTSRNGSVCVPLEGVVAVAAHDDHACAVLENGHVRCWGSNAKGELGIGSGPNALAASAVVCGAGSGSDCPSGTELAGVVALAAGATHTCALIANGRVKCWGSGAYGELGDGTTEAVRLNPVDVCASGSGADCSGGSPLGGVVAISAGHEYTCALLDNKQPKCWGGNDGRLGNGTSGVVQLTPSAVCTSGSGVACSGGAALTGVVALASGDTRSYALLENAHVAYWPDEARRAHELCYSGEQCPGSDPVDDATAVSMGSQHGCILRRSRRMWCEGENDHGELGIGHDFPASGLVLAPLPEETVAVAASSDVYCAAPPCTPPSRGSADYVPENSYSHTCAVTVTGNVTCWGANWGGQVGDGTTTERHTPVQATAGAAVRACGELAVDDAD